MKRDRRLILVSIIIALVLLSSIAVGSVFATPASWNDANFKLVWERTDKPVQDGVTARSWMWGPETVPGSPGVEPYAEAPGGNRVVQYFDKSRMEVNNPSADRSQLWFVTNGLLVREMVSGQLQLGDNKFQDRGPSSEAVAGDPASQNSSSPTYATFQNIASLNNNNPATQKSGPVQDHIDKAGNITQGAGADPGVTYAVFEPTLKHNIPNVFWNFMNQSGPVFWNGAMRTETVIDWVFAMGLPISEPYWTKSVVGGSEKDVLVQLFERRVLTYTPSNQPAFKVEMGNVGQHYYRWRYTSSSPTPTPTATPTATPEPERIAFASNRGGSYQIYTMRTDGGDVRQVTFSAGDNLYPKWSPDNMMIVFSSTRDGNPEIYVMNADGSNPVRLTNTMYGSNSPYWSPDGARIAWSEGDSILTMKADGGDVQAFTPNGSAIEWIPVYSPDGSHLAFNSSPNENSDVWTAKLDRGDFKNLTNSALTVDCRPSDWLNAKILYSTREGAKRQVWSMNDDGTNKKLLSGDTADAGVFSPDGKRIVFEQNDEIYVMNADGGAQSNISNAAGGDNYPDWSN